MELIQPAEISGKIMTLIDQAKTEVIIVSPYNKFTYWKKLTQRIEKAIQRGVVIKWYIRKNVENNVEQIRAIGIEPIEVEFLHCKIYMNECNAVVTSMNLHQFSDNSSIDIGYYITEHEKYNELISFIELYINRDIACTPVEYEENEISVIEEKTDFKDLVITHLIKLGIKEELIAQYENKMGTEIGIKNFVPNFELILEPRSGYFRIDLRINYPYTERKKIYDYLKVYEVELSSSIGFEIDFGNQMKRLKIDSVKFDNYSYDNWTKKEFMVLKPILKKTIEVYKKYTTKAVEHFGIDSKITESMRNTNPR